MHIPTYILYMQLLPELIEVEVVHVAMILLEEEEKWRWDDYKAFVAQPLHEQRRPVMS
jgi:hypothetical protein